MSSLGETILSYVGSRPYIRGADLLFWFERLRHAKPETAFGICNIKQFRVTREVRCDGMWVLERHADATAKLDFTRDDGKPGHASFIEGERPITQRVADLASTLELCERTGDFAGRARLRQAGSFTDLLNGLIETNKRLHAETLRLRGVDPAGIRLAYVQDLPTDGFGNDEPVDLTIACLSEREADGKHYTLCTLSAPVFPAAIKLCYLF